MVLVILSFCDYSRASKVLSLSWPWRSPRAGRAGAADSRRHRPGQPSRRTERRNPRSSRQPTRGGEGRRGRRTLNPRWDTHACSCWGSGWACQKIGKMMKLLANKAQGGPKMLRWGLAPIPGLGGCFLTGDWPCGWGLPQKGPGAERKPPPPHLWVMVAGPPWCRTYSDGHWAVPDRSGLLRTAL